MNFVYESRKNTLLLSFFKKCCHFDHQKEVLHCHVTLESRQTILQELSPKLGSPKQPRLITSTTCQGKNIYFIVFWGELSLKYVASTLVTTYLHS